jgi:hypothetical protein
VVGTRYTRDSRKYRNNKVPRFYNEEPEKKNKNAIRSSTATTEEGALVMAVFTRARDYPLHAEPMINAITNST